MSNRDIILEILKMSDMTIRQLCKETGLGSQQVSHCIYKMKISGYIAENGTKGGRKVYCINSKKTHLPRGTVRAYLEKHPGLTVDELAEGIPCRRPTVFEYLKNAFRDAKVLRSKNDDGEWIYEIAPDLEMTFGCANPLTMMFNKAISNVRANMQTNQLQ